VLRKLFPPTHYDGPVTLRSLLTFCLLLTACPERTLPEHGLMLVYKKSDTQSVRSVVDRRLAQLKLQANLQEDDSRLTVRAPEGTDVTRLKALLAETGQLEFCKADAAVAEHWCETTWPAGLELDHTGGQCSLQAANRKDLETALADAGVKLAFATGGTRAEVFPVAGCLSLRITAAELRETPVRSLLLEFDRASGQDFAALTTALVGKKLLIRLNGVVVSSPVVHDAITGGKAMLTTAAQSRAEMELLAASLVGGPLPGLVLEKESTWGPPSFK
jgi:preprotein translocase subunit SecD